MISGQKLAEPWWNFSILYFTANSCITTDDDDDVMSAVCVQLMIGCRWSSTTLPQTAQ